ncbi:MAG TPA: phosphatidate cytidylyltransferase [Pirellulales bacterium]|jgi:phosphatidate cytidylyltransferase|nr:phosphatidate cytidylyltransferase [Pirellulales bacterium]
MLRWRLLLGTMFIAALVGLCWLDGTGVAGLPPGGWLFPLVVLLSIVASGEMLWMFATRPADERPSACLVYFGNLAIVGINAVPLFCRAGQTASPVARLGWPMAAFLVAVLIGFVGEMRRYERPGQSLARLSLAILALVYVGLLLSCAMQLRILRGGPGDRGNHVGLTAVASLIAVVKMGDTGAYTVGRLFGRHKMTPLLSPGKTWEGFVGAVVFAAVAGWLVLRLLPGAIGGPDVALGSVREPLGRWQWLAYGIIVGIAGLLGDLAESLIKRDSGRKDSSPWMPGFGGLLDLLDSILFAAPVAWLCWATGLV